MKLCIVHSDIGNYHHARFQAVATHVTPDVIQIGGKSTFAEFKKDGAEGAGYRLRTLFPERQYLDVLEGRGVTPGQLRRELHGALDQLAPEVVVVKGYSFLDSLQTMDWCRRHRVPVVVMSESQAKDFARSGVKEALKRRLLADASAALVGGTPHAEYMHSLGLEKDRIFVGYDAVENDHFQRGADAARIHAGTLRAELGLPQRFFLASARFIPKKNLVLLIEAYADYRKKAVGEPWSLVILGDGPDRPRLERLRAELGLEGQVLLPGFRGYRDLPTWYGLSSAFVHASTREQWGLVVNEAMAAGLPIVVSAQCGCAQDLVPDGRNGFVFDAEDRGGLADRLLRVSADPARAEAMGRESRAIIAHWSPELFGQNLMKAAEVALSRPRRTSFLVQSPLYWALERKAAMAASEENK